MSDNPTFDWLGIREGKDDCDAYVSITYVWPRGMWEIKTSDLYGFSDGTTLDDSAVSAWSTVAYILCEHGATSEETDEMVQAAPEHLEWCFDGQVGMYAYDKNEEWDG